VRTGGEIAKYGVFAVKNLEYLPMENIETVLAYEIAGIPLKLVLLSFLVLLFTFAVKRFIVNRLLGLIDKLVLKTRTEWDDELVKQAKRPIGWLVVIIGVWIAIGILNLPSEPFDFPVAVNRGGRIAIILIITWFFFRAMDTINRILRTKATDPDHWMDTGLVPLFIISLKVMGGILFVVLIAQNLGYSVSGLVASLGIGGIAVALAAKDTLANFLGSLMLMIDRPFKLGQWIKDKDGKFEGVVEEIGFRTTRIRTFEKTIEVIPNDRLANIVVENMDRRKDRNINMRRVKMMIGLEYKTTADQMEQAVEDIREILRISANVDQRQILVYFNDFGESSLNIFVYYYAATTSWEKWLEIKQEINLKIMRKLAERGLAIAFPSRSIYLEKTGGQPGEEPLPEQA